MTPNAEYASSLLGQQVIITLAHASENGGRAVLAKGTLLSWSDGGDAVVQDAMGFLHHCWPMLDIEPAQNDGSEAGQ